MSITYYDPDTRTWHQNWVGDDGLILHLEGERTDDGMVLEGKRMTDDGPVRDRVRWEALEDGRVRQVWSVSSDGSSWERVFVGYYELIQDSTDS